MKALLGAFITVTVFYLIKYNLSRFREITSLAAFHSRVLLATLWNDIIEELSSYTQDTQYHIKVK